MPPKRPQKHGRDEDESVVVAGGAPAPHATKAQRTRAPREVEAEEAQRRSVAALLEQRRAARDARIIAKDKERRQRQAEAPEGEGEDDGEGNEWEDVTSSEGSDAAASDDNDVDERFDEIDDGEIVEATDSENDDDDDDEEDDDEEDGDEEDEEEGAAGAAGEADPAFAAFVGAHSGTKSAAKSAAKAEKAQKKVAFAPGAQPLVQDDEDDQAATVWRGDAQSEGKTLTYSNRAYDCFFQLRTEYPCLSFEILRDDAGEARTRYPLSLHLVCGSQADAANKNQLYVLRVTNIRKTKNDIADDEESDDEDDFIGDAEDDDEDDEDPNADDINNGEPVVDYRTIPHHGTANRVRCDPKSRHLCAVWSDAGRVQIFDIDNDVRAMADFANWSKEQAGLVTAASASSPAGAAAASAQRGGAKSALRFSSSASTHQTEGYGLGWSPVADHVFATGDCAGQIFVWKPSDGGRWLPFSSSPASTSRAPQHSVEEISWSPTQPDVFIAARAHGSVEVWDSRDMKGPRVQWKADPTDINVAHWNPNTRSSHLLITGADSGLVSVWDLRSLKATTGGPMQSPQPLQQLLYHHGTPITSVEFSLHNECVFSVTTGNGQCTLWDLSLERDADEEREVLGELFGRNDVSDLPDQLMFLHQGLEHPKDCHFHAQIPGMVLTTDFHGLHLFKPMNWKSLMK